NTPSTSTRSAISSARHAAAHHSRKAPDPAAWPWWKSICAAYPASISPPSRSPRSTALQCSSGEGTRLPQQLIGLHHPLQQSLMAAVPAVAVGVIAADQQRIALAQLGAVSPGAETHDRQRLPLARGETGGF